MRNLILIPIIILLTVTAVGQDVLEKYKSQTPRTDPGEYASMYDNLPEDLRSLCSLVKNNLIHPQEAMSTNLSEENMINDGAIPDVKGILESIAKKGDKDLKVQRTPEEKLVLACYHHSILLASILRHQGIPVRLRAGYSLFFEKQAGVRFGHIICEVWDKRDQRWILVDPDREIVDMGSDDFEFASSGFMKIRKGNVDPRRYISSVSTGFKGSVYLLLLDAAFVTQDEKLYYNLPGLLLKDFSKPKHLDRKTLENLEDLASAFTNLDSRVRDINRLFHSNREFKPSGLDYDSYYEMISKNR